MRNSKKAAPTFTICGINFAKSGFSEANNTMTDARSTL